MKKNTVGNDETIVFYKWVIQGASL